MKINKRKCRAYAVPDRKLSSANGILHAKQINYIVTAAVKTIAHHRTLVLYIYPREQAVRGDYKPLWTMFHTKDDFLTLERKEDGSTAWRTASFDRLDCSSYDFSSQCAFYSNLDGKRVQRYFHADTDGFLALTAAQDAILERRRKERQITREKAVIDRIEGIPALPHGLKSWIKSVMPAYFFYDYKREKEVTGICSACSHEITLSDIKQGSKAICPHCRHELIAKPRSRRGSNMYDRETFEVIQNMGDGRLVVRIIKAYYSYRADIPEIDIYENARQFIWRDSDGEICTEHYYYSCNSGIITNWKKGERPVYFMYQYHFEGDTCGHLYTKNLPKVFFGTPWQYCNIADFYHHFHEHMQALPFLREYLQHPRLEHLCKMGFYNIVSDLAYHSDGKILDETQNRTHKILGIAAEDVDFLRGLDVDLAVLKIFQSYAGIKDRQQLLVWQLANDVKHNILPILKYITVHKLIRYTERQFLPQRSRKGQYGCTHYQKMQDIVTDYRDYLEMCDGLDYDLKNSFVLYPKALRKAHDRVQKRFKIKESAQLMQDFKAAVRDARERMAFEAGGMKIVVPATPRELEAEGNALHHCVGSYADRVAKKECMILFLRQCTDEAKPFYTIEIRGSKIIQVRGIGNCSMTPEVKAFVEQWRRQVLQRVADNAA